MATYIVMNLAVMAAVGLGLLLFRARLNWRVIAAMGGLLLVLTAVFDSLIIWAGIVAYDMAKTLGVTIGRAPIEDFAYTLVAIVLVPYVWTKLEAKKS